MWGTFKSFGKGLGEFWSLTAPYFKSEEKKSAYILLAAVVVLTIFVVEINVAFTYWYNDFWNALQRYDWPKAAALLYMPIVRPEKGHVMTGFCELAFSFVFINVYIAYLSSMLQIKWRQWLTRHYVTDWLSNRAYYSISLAAQPGSVVDNPDQRISDDLNNFTLNGLALGQAFLSNLVTVASFVVVLYTVSGSITVLGVTIHGYMLWAAIIYSILGTLITHRIGRKLIKLNFEQQRFEAGFRYRLVRVRENPEGIALSKGEAEEQAELLSSFQFIRDNFWSIMNRTKGVNFFSIGFLQTGIIVPLVLVLPRYFAKKIGIGGIMQITSVFTQTQQALSWFVSSYTVLATFRSTVTRLYGFREAMEAARLVSHNGPQVSEAGAELVVKDLTLTLQDGRKLLDHANITLTPGELMTISGPSGTGKSTLFRALAGVWPYGTGEVSRPSGRLLFLPQKPYCVLGTLKRNLAYPEAADSITDEAAIEALQAVGLGALAPRLLEVATWGLALSGGEQQRLALARALLSQPDWLFLDEATSALDKAASEEIRAMLRAKLPTTTIIAISHNEIASRHVTLHEGGLLLSD